MLTIIGMASILVVPNVGNLDARSFSAQIRQATAQLNYARRSAVVGGQPATIEFIPGEQAATDITDNPVQWRSDTIALRYRDSTDQEIDVEDSLEITFYPEGGSSGGTLIFQRQDQQAAIHIDPFTGRITPQVEDDS